MSLSSYVKELGPKVIKYKAYKSGLTKTPPSPMVLTYSVTNICNSRCKSCNIWKIYRDEPDRLKKELKLDEVEKTFKTIDPLYFFNISGGEPFLRKDLPEIVRLASIHLKPKVIHTPTNAICPELVEKGTRKILENLREEKHEVPFTIKPSFDGIHEKHDKIRGVENNFKNVLDTLSRLKGLQKEYPNLEIGLGTVISKFNLNDLPEIFDFVEKLDVDSYINEIAEERSELFTLNTGITPSAEEYKKATDYFSKRIKSQFKKGKKLPKYTQAFRLVYYDLVVEILKQKKQVIPCYAGITNVHINPYGDVWPCCILGYNGSMGNLRDFDYDFKKVWMSREAKNIRKSISNKECSCPLANQAYSNILCDPKSMLKVSKHLIF
jgi:radical SAM protein with 4Fe4S-binding SPASM domain